VSEVLAGTVEVLDSCGRIFRESVLFSFLAAVESDFVVAGGIGASRSRQGGGGSSSLRFVLTGREALARGLRLSGLTSGTATGIDRRWK
jgi:hypothetical protein